MNKSPMLLDVVKVKVKPNYQLWLEFENGEWRTFDMNPFLEKGVFRQLQDSRLFSAAHVDYGTVAWPGDIDMAPETLYGLSLPIDQADNVHI